MTPHELVKKYVGGPTTTEEATQFIQDCVAVIGAAFHPDTNFADYAVSNGDAVDSPLFTTEQWMVLEESLDRAFGLLADPYAVAVRSLTP